MRIERGGGVKAKADNHMYFEKRNKKEKKENSEEKIKRVKRVGRKNGRNTDRKRTVSFH